MWDLFPLITFIIELLLLLLQRLYSYFQLKVLLFNRVIYCCFISHLYFVNTSIQSCFELQTRKVLLEVPIRLLLIKEEQVDTIQSKEDLSLFAQRRIWYFGEILDRQEEMKIMEKIINTNIFQTISEDLYNKTEQMIFFTLTMNLKM